MRLRRRIALVTFAATAPMVGGLVWLDVRAQQTAAEAELAELVLARAELPGERERCIADGQAGTSLRAQRGGASAACLEPTRGHRAMLGCVLTG